MSAIERARADLNSLPWWRPFKRQEAGRRYRYALLAAALAELGIERCHWPKCGPICRCDGRPR